MLMKYVDRETAVGSTALGDVIPSLPKHVEVGMVDVIDDEGLLLESNMPSITSPPLQAKETYLDVDITPELSVEQQKEVKELLFEYPDVLSDLPGRTYCIEYKIRLTHSDPIRSKAYPLPHHMRKVVVSEVQTMLELGVIEPLC